MLAEILVPVEGVVRVDAVDSASEVIVVCEHASYRLPGSYAGMGLAPDIQRAHIAWDPGALAVARSLAGLMGAALVSAEISRMIYDLNRPPDADAAMPGRSEIYDIPGNARIGREERLARTWAVYLPFHETLHRVIAGSLALGRRPAVVTVHSFTPVYFGKPRSVELGIIHDADPRLALRVLTAARAQTGLVVELNAPYSATDGVTHTLRLQATPYGLDNVMIEIRSDLIATEAQQDEMAHTLHSLLGAAITSLADERRKDQR